MPIQDTLGYTTIPTNGLVASYDLDGDALDSSGNGNNGSATNVTYVLAEKGYVSEVGSFNGSSSKVETSVQIGTGYTVSYFGYIDKTLGVNQSLIADVDKSTTNNMLGLYYNDATETIDQFLFSPTETFEVIQSISISSSGWYHIVGYFENGNWKLSVNLQEVTSTTSYTLPTGLDGIAFGALVDSTPGYFQGKIGLVRIYSRELSLSEINNLYQEGLRKLGPSNARLSGDFPHYSLPNLEEGKVLEYSKSQSGGVYYDQTGNGNNGTATNVIDSTNGLYNVMSFNGSSSEITKTSFPGASTSATSISMRIKFDTLPGNNSTGFFQYGIVGTTRNNHRLIYVSGNLLWQTRTALADYRYYEVINSPSIGELYHITLTWDGTTKKTYINGIENTNLAFSGGSDTDFNNINNNQDLYFGKNVSSGTSYYFDGQISQPIIYNRALSAREIKQLYYSNFIPN